MTVLDAARDAVVDAASMVDARRPDARPPPDAQPRIDMAPVIDAQPSVPDAEVDMPVAPPPDMAAPEPDPLPEPLPDPEPDPSLFTGLECGDVDHICVRVAADATIRIHEPEYRSGLDAGDVLNLQRDNQYGERSDVLVGFVLRPRPEGSVGDLELLLPRSGGPKDYPLPTNAAFVPTAWDEESIDWNFGLHREAGVAADGVSQGDFVVFPLDEFGAHAEAGGRFSIELTLRTDGDFDFYSRETMNRSDARLRFRRRGE